jgi:hypothetical protein
MDAHVSPLLLDLTEELLHWPTARTLLCGPADVAAAAAAGSSHAPGPLAALADAVLAELARDDDGMTRARLAGALVSRLRSGDGEDRLTAAELVRGASRFVAALDEAQHPGPVTTHQPAPPESTAAVAAGLWAQRVALRVALAAAEALRPEARDAAHVLSAFAGMLTAAASGVLRAAAVLLGDAACGPGGAPARTPHSSGSLPLQAGRSLVCLPSPCSVAC